MFALAKRVLPFLPAAALLAACGSPPPERPVVVNTPPPTVVAPPPAVVAPPAVSGSAVAPRRLTTAEVASMVTNNTLTGMGRDGTPYTAYFAGDGSEHFRHGTVVDAGTWRVTPDGLLCTRLARMSGGTERCYALARYGEVTLFERPDGVAEGSVHVLPGNPNDI